MDDDQRTRPPYTADERETLTGLLRWQRETLEWKCSGLSPARLKERAVPPSQLSLLGLVRHMDIVERSWFNTVMRGGKLPAAWAQAAGTGELPEFDVAEADVEECFASWRRACAQSDDFVRQESLDVTRHYSEWTFNLRYVLGHMIEEYARHNGHADLLRERLDGSTGE